MNGLFSTFCSQSKIRDTLDKKLEEQEACAKHYEPIDTALTPILKEIKDFRDKVRVHVRGTACLGSYLSARCVHTPACTHDQEGLHLLPRRMHARMHPMCSN